MAIEEITYQGPWL